MNVFDGFQALAVEQADAVSAPVQFEPAIGGEPPAPESAAAPRVSAAPMAAAAATAPEPSAPSTSPEELKPPAQQRRMTAKVSEFLSSPAGKRLGRKPTRAELWIAGSGVLVVMLGLQIAFAYRSELAVRSSTLRKAFTIGCKVAGCTVALPQRPDLVRIEASDVHMIDTSRPALVQLTTTLRSYASHDVGYPALDLVLTNANEHAVARRIFLPNEYLDPTRDPQAGFPAKAEITVALDLDMGDLNAAGFRLDLIAAPAP